MAVEIRSAKPGEEESILAAYEWLFAPPGSRPPHWDPERAKRPLGEAIRSPDAEVLVADDGAGEIVGLCTAYLDLRSVRFGLRCWVEDLAVHPDHRSRGIGTQLLIAARAWARSRGATHLELDTAESRTDAQRFYDHQDPAWRSISYAWVL